MNPTVLGGLIKRVYNNFDITDFNNRLKFQKFIYLLQECGLNLGYEFKLYLHGPYSTLLTRDGFDMPPMNNCKEVYFGDTKKDKLFNELLKFLENHKDNPENMEILASLILFKRLSPEKNEKEIINLVIRKDYKFKDKEEKIRELLNKIKKFGKIEWQN